MSRELKFRAWDKVDYMSTPFTLKDLQLKRVSFTDDCPIMQFTGLKDKNGKEIYEGDVLGGYPHGTAGVRWSDEYACFESFWNEDIESSDDDGESIEVERTSLLANELDNCKDEWCVIGNIYENPDLLV